MEEQEGHSVRGRGWVKFDQDDQAGVPDNQENSQEDPKVSSTASIDMTRGGETVVANGETHEVPAVMQHTVLETVDRTRSMDNGDVLVSLVPVNERFPWVTPAKFRPELVPEELMAPQLTLTVEDYVSSMEKLVTDMRFNLYIILYKRILVIWIFSAFMILLGILFSKKTGLVLFGMGVAWLICNAVAIFLCMWLKMKLNKMLESCMAMVNVGLIKHNLLLGLDDRGKVSCHKVNICFVYFNPTECLAKLEKLLNEKPDENTENGEIFDREAYLRDTEGFNSVEVVVAGRNSVTVNKGERAQKLLLHYTQRWCKDYLRRRLDWVVEDVYGRQDYTSNTNPRHLKGALCPCQYIEEHLKNKRQRESLNPCVFTSNQCHWCD